MPPQKTVPPQQFNQSSIKFQAQCSERVEQDMESNNPINSEIMRFKNMILGTLIIGSGLCLGGTGLYLLSQSVK